MSRPSAPSETPSAFRPKRDLRRRASAIRRIVLKKSKSGDAEFFARRKGNREFTLDLSPHAVSRLHVAKARVRPPPRPKIVHGPLRRRNSSIFGEKGVFQQNRHNPDLRLTASEGPFTSGLSPHSRLDPEPPRMHTNDPTRKFRLLPMAE